MLELELTQRSPALKTRHSAGNTQVFDPVRKKWVAFTQEELVRQLLIQYFVDAEFPLARMSVERQILVHGMQRRYDLVLWDKQANPVLLAECKAPSILVSQDTLDQIARYNLALQVPYLCVTNGRTTYCCAIDFERQQWAFLDAMPRIL